MTRHQSEGNGSMMDDQDKAGTDEALTQGEAAKIEEQAAPRAVVVHEVVRHEGEIELGWPLDALV